MLINRPESIPKERLSKIEYFENGIRSSIPENCFT